MERNSIIFGVLVSLVLPLIGMLIWMGINYILYLSDVTDRFGNVFQFTFKTRVLTSICLNLIPFHYSKNRRWDYMMRGVGVATLALLFGWAFYFGVFKF